MVLSISAVVLLGALVLTTVRKSGHKIWHAAGATLFGFYLAKTSAAPAIAHAVDALVTAFSHVHL